MTLVTAGVLALSAAPAVALSPVESLEAQHETSIAEVSAAAAPIVQTQVTHASPIATSAALLAQAQPFVIQDAIDAAAPGDTVVIPVGTYTENLTIDKALTLEGGNPGDPAATVIDGANKQGVSVTGGPVIIRHLTIENGRDRQGGAIGADTDLTVENLVIRSNTGTRLGGGIYMKSGDLVVVDTTFDGNEAALGGAINHDSNSGTLVVSGSTFSSNAVSTSGGAIHTSAGMATLTDSQIIGNTASRDGGGIFNAGALTLDTVTVSGNTAGQDGGGLFIKDVVAISYSTFDGNQAERGGGIGYFGDASESPSTVVESTISGNVAETGAGLFKGGSAQTSVLTFNNVTVAANSSTDGAGGGLAGGVIVSSGTGPLELANSIVAGNFDEAGSPDCDGISTDAGYNLLGKGSVANAAAGTAAGCGLTDGVNGNLVGYLEAGGEIDPELGPLDLNGAPTPTHAISQTSSALDAGNMTGLGGLQACGPVSQNLKTRPIGDGCDIGAFERDASPSITASLTLSDTNPPPGITSIPIDDLPPEALTTGPAAEQDEAIVNTPLSNIDSSPVGSVPVGSVPVGSVPVGSVGFDFDALDEVLLIDIPVEGGWEQYLQLPGSTLTGPVQTYTFRDALNDAVVAAAIDSLTFQELGLGDSTLGLIPILAVALGSTPISEIPLDTAHITPTQILQGWCDLLAGSATPCSALGISPGTPSTADGVTLMTLTLASAPVGSVPVGSVPVGSVDIVGTPVGSVPVGSVDLLATPVGSVPVGSVPVGSVGDIIDCSVPVDFDCMDPSNTLADVPADKWNVSTYGELIDFLVNQGLLADVSLAEVIAGIVLREEFAWENIDLGAVDLALFAANRTIVTYTADFTVENGDPTNTVVLTAALPPGGFAYVPGTSVFSPPANPGESEPTQSGDLLTWNLTGIGPDTTVQVTFDTTSSLQLGPVATSIDASIPVLAISGADAENLSVQEGLEPNDTIATATPVTPDVLYLTHISSATDTDFYKIPNVPIGAQISVIVANLPADLDVILYSPEAPQLRGAPERTVIGIDDPQLNALGPAEADPELANDVLVEQFPGLSVHTISTNRALGDELFKTEPVSRGGDYYIRIVGYNGASSIDPYTARFRVIPGPTPRVCQANPLVGGTPGVLPASLPANVNTLFLWNQQRFEVAHPGRSAQVLTAMQALTNQPSLGVIGAIVPVEGDPDVAAAYSAWNGDPCNVDAANAVASEVGALIDGYRAAHPTIENIVLVGVDDQIPHFRMLGATKIAKEQAYQGTIDSVLNEATAAAAGGYYFSDDPFADPNPVIAKGRPIFVPELAIGRLGESPDDIVTTLQNFLIYNGLLDPTTSTSSYVAADDFLIDSAEFIRDDLIAAGRPALSVDDTELANGWNKAALVDGWFDPTLTNVSLNAHFDHNRAQPSDPSGGLLNASEVPAGIFPNLILHTVGCHSGFAPSDVQISGANSNDWAQTLQSQGATIVAQTGYAYGETTPGQPALSERLMMYFAQNLAGHVTSGEALLYAKHRYAGEELLYAGYDDKVLMEAIHWGLPMYRVYDDGTPPPVPVPPPSFVDGQTGLTASVFSIAPSFTENDTDRGTYWDVSGEAQVTAFRPIQPKVTTDVTVSDALAARGALITAVTSADVLDVDPVFARPTVDNSENEPELINPGIFPTVLQSIQRYLTPAGPRDQLVIVPGQFFSNTNDATIGNQRLFTQLDGIVYYSAVDVADKNPPTILRSEGTEITNGVSFEVEVVDLEGSVVRVYMLVRDPAAPTGWLGTDLVPRGGNLWSGITATGAGLKEFCTQAVDDAGNVAVSCNKGEYFEAVVPANPSSIIQLSGTKVGDWYVSPVGVDLDVVANVLVEYNLDNTGLQPFTGPFVVGDDGIHGLEVLVSDGTTDAAAIPIDQTGPVAVSPLHGASVPLGSVISPEFDCVDAGAGVDTCTTTASDPLPTNALGEFSFDVEATDIVGNSATTTITYFVIDPPAVIINEAPPAGALEGDELTFTASTSAPTPSYSWTVTRDGGLYLTAGGSSLTFVAADDGDYVVTVDMTQDGVAAPGDSRSFPVGDVPPTILLSGPPDTVTGQTYTLELGSVIDPGTDNTFSYVINWGDGLSDTVNTLEPVTHTYAVPGDYTITVDLVDEEGTYPAAGTLAITVFAPPELTVDNAAVEIDEGETAMNSGTFSATGTTTITADVGTPILDTDTWSWTFDSSDGPDESQTVTVTLTDDIGSVDVTFALTVNNVAPTIVVSGDAAVAEGSVYSLTLGVVTDPGDDTVTSYVVDWGDGASESYTSAGVKTHTYADGDATHQISVDLVDEDGPHIGAGSSSVDVTNVAPTIVVSGDAAVAEGSVYSLTLGVVTDPGDDTVTSYVVDWGDGASESYTSAGVKTHTYADGDATHQISVDLVDEDGPHIGAGSSSVDVTNVAPTIVVSGDAAVAEGSVYSLTLGVVTDPGDDTVTSYVVDWGDGASESYTSAGVKTHTYADGDATHQISVDLVDEDGTHVDAGALNVAVNNVAPTAALTGDATGFVGVQYTVTVGAATDPGDDIVTEWTVNWGDGSSTTLGAPGSSAHTYASAADYSITLDLTDEDGTFVAVDTLVVSIVPVGALACVVLTPTIVGTAADDVINGTPGDDIIFGLDGDDVINGAGGDDIICGGQGDNELNGGAGADTLIGDMGRDQIDGGGGHDTIYAGGGDDRIEGSSGNDEIFGEDGKDTIDGDSGNDFLDGGAGSDNINGGPGQDTCANGENVRNCEFIL